MQLAHRNSNAATQLPPINDLAAESEHSALLRHTKSDTSDTESVSPPAQTSRWTPVVILVFLLAINTLIYYDRGAISATVAYIKTDELIAGGPENMLSGGKAGLLGSAFMGGYMLFCPFFAMLANYIAPTKLMAIGTAGWMCAALSMSVANNYPWLLMSRIMVGIGEASFTGLAPSTIDNIAPLSSKTLWLGLFFAAIPVGQAVGIALGGLIAANLPVVLGSWTMVGWRVVFFTEALAMLPLSLMCWRLPAHINHKPTANEGTNLPPAGPEVSYKAHEALVALLRNPTWILTSLGYSAYTFVIGALAFWGPTLVTQPPLSMSPAAGTAVFGVTTALCGFAGTALGGVINDWIGQGSTGALRYVAFSLLASFPIGLLCFYSTSPAAFFIFLALVELFLFNTQAPVNAVLLDCVPTGLRNFSMSYNVLIIHLLGDTPSPYLVGQLSDWLRPHHGGSALHTALIFCYLWNLVAILFYFVAWRVHSAGLGARPRFSYGPVP